MTPIFATCEPASSSSRTWTVIVLAVFVLAYLGVAWALIHRARGERLLLTAVFAGGFLLTAVLVFSLLGADEEDDQFWLRAGIGAGMAVLAGVVVAALPGRRHRILPPALGALGAAGGVGSLFVLFIGALAISGSCLD